MLKKISKLFTKSLPLLAAVVLVLVLANVASACPTCKDALAENDPKGQAMVSGYFYSILFMMGMPFAILGTLGGYVFFSIRKAESKTNGQEEAE